tara:strand:- start:349 stop:2016 length:1668 start_codon:yes stop_codon:yes gene_type:complete
MEKTDTSSFDSAHNKRFSKKGKNYLELNSNKKNILLIGPQTELSAAERSFMAPALGVVRLAGYLNKNGHYAEHYEPNLKILTNEGPDLQEVLKERKWDIIGFSLLEETLIHDIKNMHLAEKLCPEAIFVAGGIEAQFNYQNVLDKTPCNIVIISEGEKSLLKIANGIPLHEIPGTVFKNNSLPLDQQTFDIATSAIEWEKLPYEKYWDYYVKKYGDAITEENIKEIHTVRVFGRNRCPIGCKFCSSTNQITWGSDQKVPVISASEDTLVHNIKRIVESHPRVKTIYLTDDDFCINKASVIKFCKQIIEAAFEDLTFMSFCRASDADDEMFYWMKRANFRRLNIGIESFSQEILHDMGKRCTVKQNHDCLKLAKKHKIPTYFNLIITTPNCTLEQVEDCISQALEYAEDPFYKFGVILGIKPLKGTEYYETYADYRTRIVPIENTRHHIKYDDLIYSSDERVKYIQLKYWNEIDEFIKRERKRNKIYHAIDANVSYLKLMFFMDKIKELKSKKIRSVKSIDNKAKADPYHERQTVDIDLEELKKKKKDNKSQYGGF